MPKTSIHRFAYISCATLCILLVSACAGQQALTDLSHKVEYLGVQAIQTKQQMEEFGTIKDELYEHNLRLQFLEYEALKRGESIAPRLSMSAQDPALIVNGGRVVPNESVQISPPPTALRPTDPAGVEPVAPSDAAPATPTPITRQDEATLPEHPSGNITEPPATPQTPVVSNEPNNGSQPGSLPVPADPADQTSENAVFEQQTLASLPPSPMPAVTESSPSPAVPTADAPAESGGSEQSAYNTALQLYRSGRFAEAEAAFSAFLEVYPDSKLVPNALYWLGETYYARNMLADAIFAFKDVQTRFPQNQKTPDSLLKTAMTYQKLGDTSNASLHLLVLYEDWPRSEATLRAQRMHLRP